MTKVLIAMPIFYLVIGIGVLIAVVACSSIVWIEPPRIRHFVFIVLFWPAMIAELV